MNGLLEVKRLKDHFVQHVFYEQFLNMSLEQQQKTFQELYEKYRHKSIKLTCKCTNKGVLMSISYLTLSNSYYIRSFPKQADKHDESCHFYGEHSLSSGSDYIKNKEEDENGNSTIYLPVLDYKKVKPKVAKTTPSKTGDSNDPMENQSTHSKSSVYQLVRELLTRTWDEYIYFKGKDTYPTLSIIYRQVINRTSKKMLISKTHTLHDVMYKGGSLGSIYYLEKESSNKYHVFCLLQYKAHSMIDANDTSLLLVHPTTREELQFTVSNDGMDASLRKLNVSSGPYMVGGFVESRGYNVPPKFISMAIIPINDYGVPIESSYERALYTKLCEEKRLVQRIYTTKYHPSWNGLLPDGLLIDTEVPTILEVFGMTEQLESYHHHRAVKIDHFQSLSSYDFWFWDAFKKQDIPPLPNKKAT